MTPDEKQKLLELLADAKHWCQHAEAHDASGAPVNYDDDQATSWDVSGAVHRLFGWDRASALLVQIDRHIHGKRRAYGWPLPDPGIAAMVSMQDFNDQPQMTFDRLRAQLEAIPVWKGERRASEAAAANEGD